MDLEKLGKFIRNKRNEVGMPMSKAAARAGIGRSTLWITERGENPQTGKPSRPSKETLDRLAGVLRMNQDETEELLSLADYRVTKQSPDSPSHGSDTRETAPARPTITETNDTVYYAQDGYLHAFYKDSGEPRWPRPAKILPPRPVRDTEPISPEKKPDRLSERIRATGRLGSQPGSNIRQSTAERSRAAGLSASRPESKRILQGRTDATRKNKRRSDLRGKFLP